MIKFKVKQPKDKKVLTQMIKVKEHPQQVYNIIYNFFCVKFYIFLRKFSHVLLSLSKHDIKGNLDKIYSPASKIAINILNPH